MDKERDTKAVKQIIDKVYGDKPTAVLISRIPVEYRVVCNEEVAKAIIEAGYGDTKQAVREFAERLKKKTVIGCKEQNKGMSFYDYGWAYLDCVLVADIDDLLAEVTGK